MFNTPPQSKMVKTRNTLRKEREQDEIEDGTSQPKNPLIDKLQIQDGTPQVAASSVKSEHRPPLTVAAPPPPLSEQRAKSIMSTSSSVLARRKRLQLEAAKEKARIEMDLIDKKLEADLAELEDENYSPHKDLCPHSVSHVERWLDKSQRELHKEQPVHDDGQPQDQLPLLAAVAAGTSDGTVQMLASALKDLAATSTKNGPNANLLSRMSTPRDLPEFSGDPLEWLQFKQAYEESTQVCGFSPKENMWRLRKCLRGPAKEAVSALLISATSPEKLMSTLELRFGNPDTIISRIMQDIKKLQPLSQEYQNDIVVFSIKVQNFIAAVRAVGREEYLQGTNISSLLLSKLPTVLISKWSDYSFPLITEGIKSRLDILAEFLSNEALKITTTANVSLINMSTSRHNNNATRTHTVLVQSEIKNNKCQFCKIAEHKLTDCKKFKKALRKERWRHVKRYGICYKCLISRHERETCPAPACGQDGCGEPHHRLLHFIVRNDERDPSSADRQLAVPETSSVTETVTYVSTSDNKVLLKVVPVNIHGPNGTFSVNALLDDGATVSLISGALAARAGLRGRAETLRVCGAWNKAELVCESTVVTLNISGIDSVQYTINARSVNELNLPLQDVSIIDCDKYAYLSKIKNKLCCNGQLKPELLIGQDNCNLLLPIELCVGKCYEPSATLTPLGWCVHGVVRAPHGRRLAEPMARAALLVHAVDSNADSDAARALRDLHDEVRRSFTIDAMGVTGKLRQNADDVRAQAQLERTACLVGGRWQVGLPWKDENCKMPDSFSNAFNRLKGVEKKMAADDEYACRYKERVSHLFNNDFAAELKDVTPTLKTWYIPHFGVDNPNKSKLRLVFDAASRAHGSSLNDYLLTGPDLLASLFGIMVRFRENRVAVSGDIKDMFLRVKIRPEDQNALRFLWRSETTEPVKSYVMTSLIFGANCSPFIAQFIKNKNALRFESTQPAAVAAICQQHYMDDYLESLPDEPTAIEMVRNVTNIHKKGGFEIRNWTSNSVAVLDSVPKETLGSASVKFKIGQHYEGERTLGLIWYPATDELGFDVSLKRIPKSIVQGEQRPSKRVMLKVIMSIFDVFGFLAPFTIQGKIMLQDTWKANIDWDDEIPDDTFNKWLEWINLLKVIDKLRVPRFYQHAAIGVSEREAEPVAAAATATGHSARTLSCATVATGATSSATRQRYEKSSATSRFFPAITTALSTVHSYNNLQLHIFSDSSTKAMSTVAYWRWMNHAGNVCVAFIASKCRVAPVKPTTVPRLELQACLLAARLANTLLKEHKLTTQRRQFWCDSTTVLHWIKNNARNYNTFVANRLGEIDELTRAEEWRYVPTSLNVADIATRETYESDLFKNEWFKGPAFLYEDESAWPRCAIEPEIKSGNLECVTLVQNLAICLPVPDPFRFSSWLRLIRATAAVLKFINRCRRLPEQAYSTLIERAENLLLKQAQADSFGEEIAAIEKGKYLERHSRILNLSPTLDEHGVLRCAGRIDAASDVPPGTKRPVILDGKHQVARLLAKHYHEQAAHGNQETVVNNMKQKYWLVKLRPTVKYVASRCMLCRIRKAKPEVPRMGDLPPARMAHHQRPFTFCGLDLFGPMEVSLGRRRELRYGVLFTCLTVRAVHLETVNSLTTDSLIMALRRMAARRGWPQRLYSDNGTKLRGANTELKRAIQELDEEVLKNEAGNNAVHWTFIPPASPHWGGAWERLIRTVKSSLKVILNERAPRDEVLSTLLTEVENIVNSRPLTHVSVEPGSDEALTPNHFLLGASSNLPVAGTFDDSDLYLRKQWRKSQRLADMFWRRWVKEFLPELLPRRKWNQEQRPLQVGDLVLIVDPGAQRNVWPKAVVQQVFPGRDGRVRMVEVKTKSGTLRRSAARVARIPLGEEC